MKKHEFLAMSLPYGIKMVSNNGDNNYIAILDGIQNGIYYDEYGSEFNDYKPILHPLSDLTKPIEHEGEKFVPIEKLREIIGGSWCSVYERAVELMQEWDIDTLKDKIKYLPFEFIQLFISWHFDIADLLSKGEAIDVNTLEINPYK